MEIHFPSWKLSRSSPYAGIPWPKATIHCELWMQPQHKALSIGHICDPFAWMGSLTSVVTNEAKSLSVFYCILCHWKRGKEKEEQFVWSQEPEARPWSGVWCCGSLHIPTAQVPFAGSERISEDLRDLVFTMWLINNFPVLPIGEKSWARNTGHSCGHMISLSAEPAILGQFGA